MAPSICNGDYTCDSRIPHVCYNGMDISETPWIPAGQGI